jgi:hypothetical protein
MAAVTRLRVFCAAAVRFVMCESLSPSDPVEMKLLPYSVRMALGEQAGQLMWSQLAMLQGDTDWRPYGLSLALKALVGRPDERDQVLAAYLGELVGDTDGEPVADVLRRVSQDSPQLTVAAGKLYQVNRMGPRTFRTFFDQTVAEAEATGHAVALMAHTSLIGLQELCARKSGPFLILYPQVIATEPDGTWGHVVRPGAPTHERLLPLRADTDVRTLLEVESVTLVDDTRTTGKTLRSTAAQLEPVPGWPSVAEHRAMVTVK